jgi:hypothetical protein
MADLACCPRRAAHDRDRVDGGARNGQFVAGDRQFVNARALGRIVVPGLQRREQGFGVEALRPDLHPAAECVVLAVGEMSIVGGEGGEAPAVVEQLVHQVPAVAAVAFHGAAMVVDLDGVRGIDGAAVLDGEL